MPTLIPHTAGVGTINMTKLNDNLTLLDRPVLTTTQRNRSDTVWQPGQMVYDITLHKMCVRVAAGWEVITSV